MIRVEWDISGLVDGLKAIQSRLKDLRPAWRNVLRYMQKATKQQFASEGSRSGSAWKPLSPAYREWKAIRYPGKPLLRRTDRLFKALTGKTQDSVQDIQADSLTYGEKTGYGARHQRPKRGRLPRRKFLAVTDEDRRAITKMVRAHLEDQGVVSGFGRSR